MKKTQSLDQNGSTMLVVIFLIATAIFVYTTFGPAQNDTPVEEASTDQPSDNSNEPEGQPVTTAKIASFKAINGYSGSGKIIVQEQGGRTKLQINAALPNPFETTHYEAFLVDGSSMKKIGQLEQETALYRLTYSEIGNLSQCDTVLIKVFVPSGTVINLSPEAMEAVLPKN